MFIIFALQESHKQLKPTKMASSDLDMIENIYSLSEYKDIELWSPLGKKVIQHMQKNDWYILTHWRKGSYENLDPDLQNLVDKYKYLVNSEKKCYENLPLIFNELLTTSFFASQELMTYPFPSFFHYLDCNQKYEKDLFVVHLSREKVNLVKTLKIIDYYCYLVCQFFFPLFNMFTINTIFYQCDQIFCQNRNHFQISGGGFYTNTLENTRKNTIPWYYLKLQANRQRIFSQFLEIMLSSPNKRFDKINKSYQPLTTLKQGSKIPNEILTETILPYLVPFIGVAKLDYLNKSHKWRCMHHEIWMRLRLVCKMFNEKIFIFAVMLKLKVAVELITNAFFSFHKHTNVQVCASCFAAPQYMPCTGTTMPRNTLGLL